MPVNRLQGLELEQPYLVDDLEGFSPKIGNLVNMMSYARKTTLDTVRDLTVEQLDFLVVPSANTIGMLLLHIASVEVYYQLATFEGRSMNATELERWKAASNLGDLGRQHIKDDDLNFYLEQLQEIREKTLAELKERDDAWLLKEESFRKDMLINNYFKWFHVAEDEISHRGQMRLIRNHFMSGVSAF